MAGLGGRSYFTMVTRMTIVCGFIMSLLHDGDGGVEFYGVDDFRPGCGERTSPVLSDVPSDWGPATGMN